MLIDNAYYGHAAALAAHCGLRSTPPIWGYLQHGVTIGAPFDGYRMSNLLPKLVWGEPAAERCRRRGDRRVVVIGAPMLYLAADTPPDRASADPLGTIVFPFHGWEEADIVGRHDRFAEQIDEHESGPVTVCLYWKEAADPSVVESYAGRGFRVICNGSRSNPGFLTAQLSEMRHHRRFVTNRVGSSVFYAATLGLEVDLYGSSFGLGTAAEAEQARLLSNLRWPELASRSIDQEAFRQAARRELGANSLLEGHELRRVLGWTPVRRSTTPLVHGMIAARRHIRRLRPNDGEVMPAQLLAPETP